MPPFDGTRFQVHNIVIWHEVETDSIRAELGYSVLPKQCGPTHSQLPSLLAKLRIC
jgi:hypothetical protein